jgi:hypothetical protein
MSFNYIQICLFLTKFTQPVKLQETLYLNYFLIDILSFILNATILLPRVPIL